jgi:hypothetical protein
MRELNINEIKEVSGGRRALAHAVLGILGGEIFNGLRGMSFPPRRTGGGGQMNRTLRNAYYNKS